VVVSAINKAVEVLTTTESVPTKWSEVVEVKALIDLITNMKQDNTKLKDEVVLRDSQISILKKTIKNLAHENKTALETIQDLKAKTKVFAAAAEAVKINEPPSLFKKTGMNTSESNSPRGSSLSPRSQLSRPRSPLSKAPTTSTTTSSKHPTSATPVKIIPPTPNNTPLMKLDPHHHTNSSPRNRSPSPLGSTISISPIARQASANIESTANFHQALDAAASSQKTAKTQNVDSKSKMENIAERLLRSFRTTPIATVSKQVDHMVEEVKKKFKARGIELPFTKKSDCAYVLGTNRNNQRLMHLNIVGGELKVRLGGGYQDLDEVLERMLVKINTTPSIAIGRKQ